MRKNMPVFIVAAMVLALSGTVSAEDCQANIVNSDTDALNKFRQNTTYLREQLKVKDLELRGIYAYDGLDTQRVATLEDDIKKLKEKIRSVAVGMGLKPCNCL